MTADELYSKDHVPDPVTEGAVAAAMAATAPTRKSLGERSATFVLIFIGLLLSSLIVLGVFNAISANSANNKVAEQQRELAKQNSCLTSLVHNFLVDQQSRAIIAADDRNAVRDLIRDITQAKTLPQKIRAIDNFNARSKINDVRRSQLPTNHPECAGIAPAKFSVPSAVIVPALPKTSTSAPLTPSPAATATHSPASAHSTPTPTPTSQPRTSAAAPQPAPAPKPAPKPSRTTPRPVPVPTPPPLLRLPSAVPLPHVCVGPFCIL